MEKAPDHKQMQIADLQKRVEVLEAFGLRYQELVLRAIRDLPVRVSNPELDADIENWQVDLHNMLQHHRARKA